MIAAGTSTADLKSLRCTRRVRSGTSDRQSGAGLNKSASAHDFPKFMKMRTAAEHELRKVGTGRKRNALMKYSLRFRHQYIIAPAAEPSRVPRKAS
jgi:hypothetical protein